MHMHLNPCYKAAIFSEDIGTVAQPISFSLDSTGDIQTAIYRSSIHVLGYKLCHPSSLE